MSEKPARQSAASNALLFSIFSDCHQLCKQLTSAKSGNTCESPASGCPTLEQDLSRCLSSDVDFEHRSVEFDLDPFDFDELALGYPDDAKVRFCFKSIGWFFSL
jgi:hypothetical protein